MNDNHQFTKAEISKILSKASEIQKQKELYGFQEGLNKAELIVLAKEVGIDEEVLMEALSRHNEPENKKEYQFWKASSKIIDSHTFKGTITEDVWEGIVRDIRMITGGIGKTSQNKSTFEWEQRRSDFGYKHISLTNQNDKIVVQMVNNWTSAKVIVTTLSAFAFIILFLIFAKSAGFKSSLGLFFPLGGIFGFGVSRLILKSIFKEQTNQIAHIFSSIGKKLSNLSSPKPIIDLDSDFEVETNTLENPSKTSIQT